MTETLVVEIRIHDANREWATSTLLRRSFDYNLWGATPNELKGNKINAHGYYKDQPELLIEVISVDFLGQQSLKFRNAPAIRLNCTWRHPHPSQESIDAVIKILKEDNYRVVDALGRLVDA